MKEKEITGTIDSLFWKIAIKDDEIAFRTLFFQFFSPLCVFAHRYVDRWETCEDIVQETFFKIWKNRKNMILLGGNALNIVGNYILIKRNKTGNKKRSKAMLYSIPPVTFIRLSNWSRCYRLH